MYTMDCLSTRVFNSVSASLAPKQFLDFGQVLESSKNKSLSPGSLLCPTLSDLSVSNSKDTTTVRDLK